MPPTPAQLVRALRAEAERTQHSCAELEQQSKQSRADAQALSVELTWQRKACARTEEELHRLRDVVSGGHAMRQQAAAVHAQLRQEICTMGASLEQSMRELSSLRAGLQAKEEAMVEMAAREASREQALSAAQQRISQAEQAEEGWAAERAALRAELLEAGESLESQRLAREASEAEAREARRAEGEARAAERVALAQISTDSRARRSVEELERESKEAHDAWAAERELLVSEAQAARTELHLQAVKREKRLVL